MTMIADTPVHDYWDRKTRVRYPRCACYEAHVAPARRMADDPPARWVWWVGEAVDPICGGTGGAEYEAADLCGYAATRAEAERAARAALAKVSHE